ncbi:hypothetical protein TYRP_023560 [Tyrophagus putrescentiae]|nr:hypothetical protein TYRP_023560 [Tyrophagus putrescentiae]
MDQISELKAMMTQFGSAIAKLEQRQGLNPQTRSIQAIATEQTSNFSPLSGNSQCDGVNQEQKTYSIAPNNLSSESGQLQNSSELLAESQSASDGNNSETYFSIPNTSFSHPNEVSSRMDYSYKNKNDQDREQVPLRKPLVSQAMKRNHKDHSHQSKKIKSEV